MKSESAAEQREGAATAPAAPIVPASAVVADLQLLLDLPRDAIAAFKQAELLTAAAPRRPVTRKLRQVFWDTADHRLGRAGLAIGMQTTGQRRSQVLRNIKLPPTGGRILHQQDHPLNGDGLDLTRLALLPGGDPELVTRIAAEMLIPVFAIDLTRTTWSALWGETALSVALEVGAIESAAGQVEFCQVALASAAGPSQGLYDFAQRLHRAAPVQLAGHDAVQQGYRLISGQDWWPEHRHGTAELDAEMTVREGIQAIGHAATAAVRAQIHGLASHAEPEQIHEARVALRRLRSALSVFRDALPTFSRKALARDLGSLAGSLGHARELDVFLAETLEPLIQASGEETALRGLRLTAAVLRENAAEAARRAAGTPDFAALSCRLGAWFDAGLWPEPPSAEAAAVLDQPFVEFAGALLRKHHRKLLTAGAALKDPKPVELHALRIQAKRLRYTAEFVRSLFPQRAVRRYVTALKAIQDILGTLNDAVVARNLLPQLTKADPSGAPRAAGLVAGWSAAEVTSARRRFAEAWDAFAATKRFWK
jgi:triphosphatase